MDRAGLYQRVSDDQAGRSRSVEQQNAAGVLAAQRYGWFVAGTYNEPDRSASRFARKDRPEWERLLSDIAARKLDVVVLWEPSRGDRKLAAWAAFLDVCRDTGTRIYITDHDKIYDPRIARDWRSLAEDGIDSAYESEKTSARVRRGVAGAAEQGKPHGRRPYGYRRTYEYTGASRPLVHQEPDPTEAPIAREIITRISRNDSISGLIFDFAQRGITRRDGGPWSHSSIARMVREGVVYIGKRRHNGGPLLPGNWEPIVDVETYWRAVNVLSDPARKAQADGRGGIRPGRAKWLLSHIAKCDECEYPLGQQNRYGIPYYRCTSPRASHAYAPVEWMDWLVGEAIVRWCADPVVYTVLTGDDDEEAQAKRAEASAERARLDSFEQQAIAGKLSAESFARIAAGIETRIAELERQAEELSAPPALRDLLREAKQVPSARKREREIASRWLDMPLTARRSVIRKIAAPTLRPAGRGGHQLDPFRVSPNFAIPIPRYDYTQTPLLPVPVLLANRA
jgi:DNA invertase Pin-like site-specific DNA recombinase